MATNEIKLDVWAVIELMGHVRIAGRLTEEARFGSALGRVDIPQAGGGFVTQFFGGGSVYRITPCTEEVARLIAQKTDTEPVYAWDVRRAIEQKADPIDLDDDTEGETDIEDNDPPDYGLDEDEGALSAMVNTTHTR